MNEYKIFEADSCRQLDELIQDNLDKIVVIKFYSNRCQSCSAYAPIYERLNKEYGQQFIFTQANIERDILFSYKFRVTAIPTTMMVKDGIFHYKRVGALSFAEMKERFELFKNPKT